MSEEKHEIPPQRGKLIFDGRKATQFWVRAFNLEKEIEQVQQIISAKLERKWAAIPIIAEYQIDERLKFIFIINVNIDVVGIKDGAGLIYWASPEFEQEAFRIRDEYAHKLVQYMRSTGFDDIIEIETKREG